MLTIGFTDEGNLRIIQNSRGNWKILPPTKGEYHRALIGFDYECQITIFIEGMQCGTTDVLVVFSSVDSPAEVHHREVRSSPGFSLAAAAINTVFSRHCAKNHSDL